ncbi:DNA alkylation repair protein [Gottschalkiaceae bacterium SANA]|nr:DNA alkylation repair protein [Gottschalkiaceae bacterium SANA]
MKIDPFKKEFQEIANPDRARQMKAYLKGQFDFYGIPAGERRRVQKKCFLKMSAKSEPLDLFFVRACWDEDEREYQYLAIDYLRLKQKELDESHIPMLIDLILSKSWWDTVDMLASAVLGGILLGKPELMTRYPDQWIESENFWLKRTAILFQLKYRDDMDFDRLKRYCLENQNDKEFFIRKAIGWILRQASKGNPDQVKMILSAGDFSGLTIREASKYLDK